MAPSRFEVWKMFDQISPTYDKVNRILSCGLDRSWRNQLARHLPQREKLSLLDSATGTGDQLFALMERSPHLESAVGIDLSTKMIDIARGKLKKKEYSSLVLLQEASATSLPFANESFDCATISFGIRNVSDPLLALAENFRVLKKGGRLLVLEFSLPKNAALRALHLFYLRKILPHLGGWISKNREAYTYLNETIESFPYGDAFCALMEKAGFANVRAHPLTMGIVSLYCGDKV
jgi:demethylmenaquinone methyltransferase / 2-methoxy-6-polyprenyl-1,4-benzoquinol methylase